MPSFEDLRMKELDDICKTLPKDERYRLRDQIERASSSVCDNIVEGYGAYYYNDKIKRMMVARKEAVETQNHIRKLEVKKYITIEKADNLIEQYQSVIKGINGFVGYIRKKRGDKK